MLIQGTTALIEAAGSGHEMVVQLLLASGADVTIGDNHVSCLADNILAAHLNNSTVRRVHETCAQPKAALKLCSSLHSSCIV